MLVTSNSVMRGDGGIRTREPGTNPVTPLAGERFQPLSHVSICDGSLP